MAEAVAPFVGNGSILAQRDHELVEYEKILKLRDEIFAGKHPRLKVPRHAIIKATTEPPFEVSQHPTSSAIGNGTSSPAKDHTPGILQPIQSAPQPSAFFGKSFKTPRHSPVVPSSSGLSNHRHLSGPSSSSGIDPIFLTKSDTVVRAELQLQRQRLERVLKEGVDRLHKTGSALELDRTPDFDVSEVLTKALQLVKPFAGHRLDGTNGMSAATDSFDENSYYSSQVNDSTDESNGVHEPTVEEDEHNAVVSNNPKLNPYQAYGSPRYSGHRIDDLRVGNESNLGAQSHNPIQYTPPLTQVPTDSHIIRDHHDVREESEYSPPAANAYETGHLDSSHGQSSNIQFKGNKSPLNLKLGDLRSRVSHAATRQASISSPEVRIVRNHIASPIAPQPSRVSPLAVAKLPPFARERRDVQEPLAIHDDEVQIHSARQSPEETSQPTALRKKRKSRDGIDKPRKQRKGRAVDSPEPYIKEEPESPPPLSSEPNLRRSKRLQQPLRPIELDNTPSQGYKYDSRYAREYQEPSESYRYDLGPPPSASIPRVSSRVDWGDQSLRRVASLQYARRAASPPHYSADFLPSEAISARTVSHTYSDRPVMEYPSHYREPPRPYTGRYIRSEQSQSPPLIRQSPAIMAPPPRKVVMDQHGNRYYAAPPVIDLTNSVPPPNRDENINPKYAPIPVRDHVRRAPVVTADVYDEDELIESMAQPPARRVFARADVDPVDYRTYRHRDYESRPIEAIVPHDERLQFRQLRGGSYVSHAEPIPLPPRDYGPRIHSVRPETGRYEEPREYMPRLQSVRPELGFSTNGSMISEAPSRVYRELTTRPDDMHRPREYLGGGDERYTQIPHPRNRESHENASVEWPRDRLQEVRRDETRRASYRY